MNFNITSIAKDKIKELIENQQPVKLKITSYS